MWRRKEELVHLFKAFSYSKINLSSILPLLVGSMSPILLCISCVTAHKCGFTWSQELFLQWLCISFCLHQPRTSNIAECHHRGVQLFMTPRSSSVVLLVGALPEEVALVSPAAGWPWLRLSCRPPLRAAPQPLLLHSLSCHPRPCPWPPSISEHISCLLTHDPSQKYLEFSEEPVAKQLKPNLIEKTLWNRMAPPVPPPTPFRLQTGASGSRGGLEWQQQERTSALPCLGSPLPPSDTNVEKQDFPFCSRLLQGSRQSCHDLEGPLPL